MPPPSRLMPSPSPCSRRQAALCDSSLLFTVAASLRSAILQLLLLLSILARGGARAVCGEECGGARTRLLLSMAPRLLPTLIRYASPRYDVSLRHLTSSACVRGFGVWRHACAELALSARYRWHEAAWAADAHGWRRVACLSCRNALLCGAGRSFLPTMPCLLLATPSGAAGARLPGMRRSCRSPARGGCNGNVPIRIYW